MTDGVFGRTISGEPPRRALVALGVGIIAFPFGLFLLLTYAARGVFALVALLIIAAAVTAIVLAVRARRSGAAKRAARGLWHPLPSPWWARGSCSRCS